MISSRLRGGSVLLVVAFAAVAVARAQSQAPFRPPAVPLVTHDPYFSVWSMGDRLADDTTRHWTRKPNSLGALVRVDGTTYRLMGRDRLVPRALEQTGVEVLPTRTVYGFSGAGVKVQLTFLTPALPDDLDVLARPLTYVDFQVSSLDGGGHDVAVYFEAGSDLAVNTTDQPVVASRLRLDGQPVLSVGTREQPVLAKKGDDLRIDWGHLYVAADRGDALTDAIASRDEARKAFAASGSLPSSDAFPGEPRPVLAFAAGYGRVESRPVSRYFMVAYDDEFSVEYFHRRERPWWRRNGADASTLLRDARRDHDALAERSRSFDDELLSDLRRAGGEKYARLAALAYRQTLAAHKLVADVDGTAMYFPKENTSNGCIATVDVIYPSSPFMLLFNPRLLEAQLKPVLEYARLGRWKWPFAPHDLGTYPLANGQVYGGGERTEEDQMPVEESGNMLIMMAALSKVEGTARFASEYWPELTRWAEYLKEKGLDPENQLSTDDFAGHLAHNANLSIKAILALGSYARLAEMTGHQNDAAVYRRTAEGFAAKWAQLADDGDHYRLAFDKPGTWSQKYNLVWDTLLGLDLFPADIARKETAFYRTKLNAFGLPLDNRKDYTKLDWLVWTATLADARDFDTFVAPAYRFADEGPDRIPLSDWYNTVSGKVEGFSARSVVGGIFIKMLRSPETWQKYAGRALK